MTFSIALKMESLLFQFFHNNNSNLRNFFCHCCYILENITPLLECSIAMRVAFQQNE